MSTITQRALNPIVNMFYWGEGRYFILTLSLLLDKLLALPVKEVCVGASVSEYIFEVIVKLIKETA